MNDNSTAIIWSFALATSAVGAAILFSAQPGINWPIWIAAASASLLISRVVSRRRVETPLAVLLAWATLLSLGFALRSNEFLHLLIVMSDAMLLGLAVISIGCSSWSELSAKLLLTVPFLAPFRVWQASAYQAAEAPRPA